MNISGADRARFLDQASCPVWDWVVTPTHLTFDDVRLLDGRVELDGGFAEGGRLRGRIEFVDCQ